VRVAAAPRRRGRPAAGHYNGPVVFAVGAVAAAFVAVVAVFGYLVLRTVGSLTSLRDSIGQFRSEAEPLAREVIALAEEAATRAQGLGARRGGLNGRRR